MDVECGNLTFKNIHGYRTRRMALPFQFPLCLLRSEDTYILTLHQTILRNSAKPRRTPLPSTRYFSTNGPSEIGVDRISPGMPVDRHPDCVAAAVALVVDFQTHRLAASVFDRAFRTISQRHGSRQVWDFLDVNFKR